MLDVTLETGEMAVKKTHEIHEALMEVDEQRDNDYVIML